MKGAQTATFNHGRPRHADRRALRCNTNVACAKECCVPRKAITVVNGNARYFPRKASPTAKRGAIKARNVYFYIGITRASAAAFGVHDKGQSLSLGDFKDTIELLVVKKALGPGKYTVVIDSDRHVGTLIWTKRSVDCCGACDDAICCGIQTKRRRIATIALRGNSELTVLDEAVVID